jgi:hypothetical protein
MPTLVSPGVSISVTDESQYGSAGQGTVPLIILATQTNKVNVSATGYAPGTQPVNAGKLNLLTSQRELVEQFGQPQFKVIDGTPVHGAETNEYGLLAAYSYLGLANRAYVLRADIDLAQLEPSAMEPGSAPANGTYWFDLTASTFGIFEATATGTGSWVAKTPTVITDVADTTVVGGVYVPTISGTDGDYAVVALSTLASYQVWKRVSGAWVICTNAGLSKTVFASAHYSIPTATAAGDVWIKTTNPNNGLKIVVKKYVAANLPVKSPWEIQNVPVYSNDSAANTGFGSALAAGKIYAKVAAGNANYTLLKYDGSAWVALDEVPGTDAPMSAPANGTLWYNTALSADLYKKVGTKWMPVSGAVTIDSMAPSSPSAGDVWVDSSDIENYPAIHEYDGTAWVQRDTADQTTPNGVVFADLTDTAGDTSDGGGATVLTDGPNPALYPVGMMCWNAVVSTGNVKKYNATTGIWDTFSGNQEDGSPYMLRKAQRRSVVKALQAAVNENTQIREEINYFTLIACPSYPELLDEMLALNVDRKQTGFVVVDAPFRLAPKSQDLLDWMSGNNATSNGESGIITSSSMAAAYYPSLMTSDLDGNDVVVPASHAVLRTFAYNDQVSYPWFAPAGLTRGVITNATGVGYIGSEGEFIQVALTNGQRDVLYGDGSRVGINPITRFPGQGLYVFGQRTLQSFASALDRVNVARLLAYLRERFDPLARPFIFEPNDQITRANVKQVFDGFLSELMSKRAIYDFLVVCDETNNKPANIDRNELNIDVAIEPTKSAEFIYIPIRVVNTGDLSV